MSTPDPRKANERLAKSYIWYGDQCYFVSTIDRQSSAAYAPGVYAETMVWKFDWDKNLRGEIVHQDEGSQGSIKTHLEICAILHRDGLEGFANDDE